MIDFFIIGSARSGTTLLRTMLVGNPDVAIPPESYFVVPLLRSNTRVSTADAWRVIRSSGSFAEWGLSDADARSRWAKDQPRDALHAVGSVFRAYADAHDARIVGEKTPYHIRHISLLARSFPGAKFINLTRDGSDVALSVGGTYFGSRSFARNVREWSTDVTAAAAALGKLPERTLTLEYETLTASPETEMRRVCAFLGIEFCTAMLDTASRGAELLAPMRHRDHLSEIATPIRRSVRKPLTRTQEWTNRMVGGAGRSESTSQSLAKRAVNGMLDIAELSGRRVRRLRAKASTALGRRPIDRFAYTLPVEGGAGDDRVVAAILTFGQPASLQRCIDAVAAQTQPPASIIVLDNNGTPRVDPSELRSPLPVTVFRSRLNSGPAGGWANLIHLATSTDAGWYWLLDDDATPDANCLEALHDAALAENRHFVQPVIREEFSTTTRRYPAWLGPLISRTALTQVGLPRPDLVWWAEDSEFLWIRMHECGYHTRYVDSARVSHSGVRRTGRKPAWKLYYETRNSIWLRLRGRQHYRNPRMFAKLAGIVARNAMNTFRSDHPVLAVRGVACGISHGMRREQRSVPSFVAATGPRPLLGRAALTASDLVGELPGDGPDSSGDNR